MYKVNAAFFMIEVKIHQGWWEPLIVVTMGMQTQKLSTGMVGTLHNGHCRCTDPGTRHRDGGNFS